MREALEAAIDLLTAQFPDVPHSVITSMLGDSYRTVVEVTGQPLVAKAEELTRLRLEIRTRHPAQTA